MNIKRRSLLVMLRARRPAVQTARGGGYVVLTLAMIGLFSGAAIAVPVLNRATTGLASHEATGPAESIGAVSAAEHALWELENNPAFIDNMVGAVPTTRYELELPEDPDDDDNDAVEGTGQDDEDSGGFDTPNDSNGDDTNTDDTVSGNGATDNGIDGPDPIDSDDSDANIGESDSDDSNGTDGDVGGTDDSNGDGTINNDNDGGGEGDDSDGANGGSQDGQDSDDDNFDSADPDDSDDSDDNPGESNSDYSNAQDGESDSDDSDGQGGESDSDDSGGTDANTNLDESDDGGAVRINGPLADPDAVITVVASSPAPANEGLQAFLNATPDVNLSGSPATVTFTLQVFNFDTHPHDVNRITVDPLLWNPAYVLGSTTGLTTSNPSSCTDLNGCRWDLSPVVSVPGHGGSATLSFQVTGTQAAGDFWTYGGARVENFGTVNAPNARTRFMALQGGSVAASVSPSDVVAGVANTHDYTVTLTNSGTDPMTVEWVRHVATTDFSYVPGSSSGASSSDPSLTYDWASDRNFFDWNIGALVLQPGVPVTLSFQMQATLLPGVHFSRSEFKVTEDGGAFGNQPSFSTGETAPITATRQFTINAQDGDNNVDAVVVLTPGEIEIISWVETVTPPAPVAPQATPTPVPTPSPTPTPGPVAEGGQGCGPGYWKQDHHFDSWVGYGQNNDYETVFGIDASFTKDLEDTLWQGGGGQKALGRHAVAALLNAASPNVSYLYSPAQVIGMVQGAYANGNFEQVKDTLESQNELACPLN